jgi:hypothetical protein
LLTKNKIIMAKKINSPKKPVVPKKATTKSGVPKKPTTPKLKPPVKSNLPVKVGSTTPVKAQTKAVSKASNTALKAAKAAKSTGYTGGKILEKAAKKVAGKAVGKLLTMNPVAAFGAMLAQPADKSIADKVDKQRDTLKKFNGLNKKQQMIASDLVKKGVGQKTALERAVKLAPGDSLSQVLTKPLKTPTTEKKTKTKTKTQAEMQDMYDRGKSSSKSDKQSTTTATPKKQGAIIPGVTTSGSAVKKSNESTWNSTKRAELSVDRGSNMPNVARKAMPTITDMPSRANSVKELRGQIREAKKGNRKEARTSKKINRLQNKLNKLTKK